MKMLAPTIVLAIAAIILTITVTTLATQEMLQDQYSLRYHKYLGALIPWRDRTMIDELNAVALKEQDIRSKDFRSVRLMK
jgi:hypothetical protein